MDEHVHRAITSALRLRGVEVLTAQDDHRRNIPDNVLLDRARELGRVLFSQDEDLLAEATHRQRAGIAIAGVVYAHQLYCVDRYLRSGTGIDCKGSGPRRSRQLGRISDSMKSR